MAQVYVSIGSNIEPNSHIRAGLADMRQRFGTLTLSPVYESEAVGFDGDNFYNLVAAFETGVDVHSVANILREIEKNNGRKRTEKRFSARTLDLDILLYDDLIFKDMNVPRNEILKYAFVLLPLSEIAPALKHPVTGQSYADLWQAFDKQGESLWRIDVLF
ncbi:2-amino-4-hydroxy-6-hydroxymethyldihydropteridine pyrophosphokinase [Candidatus Thiomargarita nelsonii]|uniref:2-amino-4-hydroxy-6-hydroxymethyldihydropteridine diphosphokinase n=1 Tax=Candidatus Thiomargarita nelsonii TaxID=1003181 RepID=A0A4E0RIR4_9GAMM|nr:2-amino-4-hydroxy-6-hydroxymethyldihydropteridine pyrophosphokinase [Candidatus Thiomargarita nelsonii]